MDSSVVREGMNGEPDEFSGKRLPEIQRQAVKEERNARLDEVTETDRSEKSDKAPERESDRRQRIIAVCGVKNSGKTTLLARLVEELAKQGLKTAVIKHDGHDFACDIEGTDSYRLKEAGAYGMAVFSDSRIFIHKTGSKETEKELIGMFPEADIIFLEGMKDSTYPKIEIIRSGISSSPVSNSQGRFLIVTDIDQAEYGEETVGFEDIGEMIGKIFHIAAKDAVRE